MLTRTHPLPFDLFPSIANQINSTFITIVKSRGERVQEAKLQAIGSNRFEWCRLNFSSQKRFRGFIL